MRRLGLMMLLAATFGIAAAAQETTGTITGVTSDQTGGVLPGVSVTIKNTNTSTSHTFVTNEAGAYTASLLPVGQYEVTFELSGFQSVTLKNITLHVNDRLKLDGKLSVGGVAESVEVSAGQSLVQPIAALQSTITSTQVKELPLNNRNFVQLATLAPGVSSDLADEVGVGLSSTVSMSINGSRRNAVNWLVDGASNVDVGSNITLLSTPSLESIEEFKIITNGYQAEWPRSGGGVINVVTKSGSSRFSGSAYEFLRSDKFNANSYFRNLNPDPAINSTPPPLKYNNFGATVGGPVIPSRMFFFFSEEARRINRAPTALNVTTYDPAWLTDTTNPNYVPPALRDPNALKVLGLFPTPNVPGRLQFLSTQPTINNTRQEVVKVDYDLSPTYRLTGRYSHDNSFTEEPTGLFNSVPVPNVATTDTNVPGQVAAAILRSTHGGSKLNELQFQFSGNTISDTNQAADRNLRSSLGLNIPEIFPGNDLGVMPLVNVTGQLSLVGANQLYNIVYKNYTITDSFTWQRGSHAIKFGGLMTFEQKNENASNVTQGTFVFAAGGGRTAFYNFLSGNADGLCGNACTYSEAQNDVTEHLRFNRYEMFAQDSWKPAANITVDYGVRYSLYPPITDANNVLTNFLPSAYVAANAPRCANAACTLITAGTGDPLNGIIVAGKTSPFGDAIYSFDKGNIQPRIGVTWDPRSEGRTIYRSSYGIYYDQALVGIFEQNSFTNPPFVNTVSILNPKLSNPGSGTTSATTGVLALIGNGDDFKTPRTQEWSAGVQQQLYARGALDVSYVGAHGDHLIRPDRHQLSEPGRRAAARLGQSRAALPGLRCNHAARDDGAQQLLGDSLELPAQRRRRRLADAELHAQPQPDRCHQRSRRGGHPAGSAQPRRRVRRRPHGSPPHLHGELRVRDSIHEVVAQRVPEGGVRRLADCRPHVDQLGPAGVSHFRKHQRLPPGRPSEHRRRPWRRRPDGESLLVQSQRVHARGRRHVRQLGARGMASAGTQPDRPVAVEELDVQSHAAAAVPGRCHQRVQPHAVAGRSERRRPRQHLSDEPDDVQPVERHVRADSRH